MTKHLSLVGSSAKPKKAALPDRVIIDLPCSLLCLSGAAVREMVADVDDDTLIFAPYRMEPKPMLLGMITRLIQAIQIEKYAVSKLIHCLVEFDYLDNDNDHGIDISLGDGEIMALTQSRAEFRRALARDLLISVKRAGLYVNGVLPYSVERIFGAGIILVRVSGDQSNLV